MFSNKILLTLTTILNTLIVQETIANTGTDTLVLLHVLFRHGNRTTEDVSALYTTDPYKDYDFYPYGRGELTNEGKETEYTIGEALRNKYNEFLGETYTPDVLYAQSTAYNRTKASLQLVLASLFPPRNEQIWNPVLDWQPIPYNYYPRDDDPVLAAFASAAFAASFAEYELTPEYQSQKAKYQDLFDYVSENVGNSITSFTELFYIFDSLRTQDEYGLVLPEWTKSVYPYSLRKAANYFYKAIVGTDDLKRIQTGCLLSKIAYDTLDKVNGSEYLENIKLFLYSAHDINLSSLLITLGLYDYSYGTPPYGSYAVFEVHELGAGDYGIQIYFQNYTGVEPLLLTLPGCSNPCPIDDFIELTEEYYRDPSECTSGN